MQPGTSIMPGKVNPVIPEVVSQICFQIIGYDVTISMASEASELELNMAEPIIAYDLLHGLMILKNACVTLESRCVSGITANEDVCRGYVERSIGVVTALVPRIGYERGVAIAQEALASGRSVFELVREKGWLDDEELERLLAPEAMTDPRRPSEWAVMPVGIPPLAAPRRTSRRARDHSRLNRRPERLPGQRLLRRKDPAAQASSKGAQPSA